MEEVNINKFVEVDFLSDMTLSRDVEMLHTQNENRPHKTLICDYRLKLGILIRDNTEPEIVRICGDTSRAHIENKHNFKNDNKTMDKWI